MRWSLVAVASFILSCSTDTFTGGDAGDGGGDDGGSTDGATKDVGVGGEGGTGEGGASCLYFGQQQSNCGTSNWCTGEPCCASDAGAQCTGSACTSGTSFLCRDATDCTSDGGLFECCLFNAQLTTDVCPRTNKTGGSQAACVPPSQCNGGFKLCAQTSECSAANKTCQRFNIGGNTNGVTVGICL